MGHRSNMQPRKVLLAEFNEITWRLIDPLCAQGKLPVLAQMIAEGTRGAPVATEQPPNLDPWISWTSLYTGRPQEEHGVHFLEQSPETVTGPRIWEIAADAGKSVGVFGSIMSWPPRAGVKGFWVPGTFSAAPDTFPPELQPIQELNLAYTRAHSPTAEQPKPTGTLGLLLKLRKLGLRTATMARIAGFLLKSRLRPHRRWEKVSLQPVVNADFFEALYRQHRPDLATFHTNHVAHYQHRFWRMMDPKPFPVPPTQEEVRRFGPAIGHGYRVADRLLRRLRHMVDDQTVLILASGLGQQPYVVTDFRKGRSTIRIRSIDQVVRLLGLEGHCTARSVMAPQWTLKVADPARRAQAEKILTTAWYRQAGTSLFAFETIGDTICFNVAQKTLNKDLDLDAACALPDAGGFRCKLRELCALEDETPKEGHHDPVGLAVLSGPGIRRGAQLRDCTNLDFAPTMLHLLGLPIPSYMKGRVLDEAFESSPRVTVPAGAPGSAALGSRDAAEARPAMVAQ